MANILLPTSKAQVSGYKFLMRRAQHGVVLGDIRMIHDPLARRHRALYAGAAMATVLGLGAGAMAVMNPAINPGEAPIVASESGALYVRIDATLHPVTNLASARLIAGEATLRRVYKKKNSLVFQAENPKYAPIICSAETCDECIIMGKAVTFQSDVV